MATAIAVASRLVSDAHNASSENTPSAVHRLQMAIADTECAQALLELAMSIVPAPPSPPTGSPPHTESCSDIKPNLYQAPAPTKSLLKREVDNIYDDDCQQGPSDEEYYRMDIVKRIKLDHNYYWTGEDRKTGEVIMEPDQFRTYCETIKQNGSVPTSSENSQDGDMEVGSSLRPKITDKENSLHESPRMPMDVYSSFTGSMTTSQLPRLESVRTQRQRTVSETKAAPARAPRNRSCSESKMITTTWKPKVEKRTSILKSKAGKKLEEETRPTYERQRSESTSTNEMDDGSEVEEKFHKFQLLMKCLVANEPDDIRTSESFDDGQRSLSMSSDDTDEGQRSSPECMKSNLASAHDYQCQVCQKTFLKKRYLTKHAFRMHPWLNSEEDSTAGKSTSEGSQCPHCKVVIKPKKDLQRHMATCSENGKRSKKQTDLDLVSCQLCGVKMRRQLLVRHLAEEHCVDRLGEFPDRVSPYGILPNTKSDSTNGRSRAEADGVSALSSANLYDAGSMADLHSDFNPAGKESPIHTSSWQHVTEFGATTTSTKRYIHHENSTNRKAASKTPV